MNKVRLRNTLLALYLGSKTLNTLLLVSQVQIRSLQRLRNACLALAQLCWLLLTELPTEISNSNIACQLCGAITHLAWMLFWITSGVSLENTIDFIFVRC